MSVPRETPTAAAGSSEATVARETVGGAPVRGIAARILLAPLRVYRRFLSPALPARCRYYPTCSAYAEEAIRELGAVRGTITALWRLLRCNPFSNGGLDPLAERPIFHSHSRHPKRTETA